MAPSINLRRLSEMAQNHISGASIDSHYHASVHRADYHVTLTLGAGNRRRCAGIKGVTVGVTEKGGGVNLKLLLYFGTYSCLSQRVTRCFCAIVCRVNIN